MKRFKDHDIVAELQARVAATGVRKLAKELGVSPTYVSQVVNGKLPPGPGVAGPLGFVDDGYRWVKGIRAVVEKRK